MKLLVIFLLTFSIRAFATCDIALADADITQNFISYTTKLIAEQSLPADYLNILVEDIDRRRPLTNPFDNPSIQSLQWAHQANFSYYLNHEHLNQLYLRRWAKEELVKAQKVQDTKQQTQQKTQSTDIEMSFAPIKAGSYSVREADGRLVNVTLTHDFEVMTVAVTNKMWEDLMGESLSSQQNRPVANITWWSALEFANAYSIKNNLPTVYLTAEIKHKPFSSAANGTLEIKSLAEKLKLKINAPDDDIYQAKGYRLPTEAEQLFLLSNRGQSAGDYFNNFTPEEMRRHACFGKDVFKDPYVEEVGEHIAFMVGGFAFYDLYGNAKEFTSDWQTPRFEGGINPSVSLPPKTTTDRVISRGGHIFCSVEQMKINERSSALTTAREGYVSFRLVRTLK